MEKKKKTGIFHPVWILIALVLPQAVLVSIYIRSYWIVSSLLDSRESLTWLALIGAASALAVGAGIYGISVYFLKKRVHWLLSFVIVVLYTAFLYVFALNGDYLFTSSIPEWMVSPGDLVLYTGTFIIPAYFYALVLLTAWIDLRRRIRRKKQRAFLNFAAALAIPAGFYFFFNIIAIPFARKHHLYFGKVSEHALIFLVIVLSICFYFFVIRGIFLLFRRRKQKGLLTGLRFLPILFFTLVLPVLGILLNEMYFPFLFLKDKLNIDNFHTIFGDFSNPAFLILAGINGLLLTLDPPASRVLKSTGNPGLYLVFYLARVLLLPFSFYFFLVFLPFFPLCIPALFLFGTGLLLISPLVLFVVHVTILKENYRYLRLHFQKKVLIPVTACVVLVMPLFFPLSFVVQKVNLNRALSFIYHPDYSSPGKKTAVQSELLEQTLEHIKTIKAGEDRFIFEKSRVPYITPLFHRIVLGKLTLSAEKIEALEKVFLNKGGSYKTFRLVPELDGGSAFLKELEVSTNYDPRTGLYFSWIDLALENGDFRQGEYITHFDLPAGSWINDYYLYVNGGKVTGILAEKKSVLWVYRKIRSYRRDPGILYYTDHNSVQLKVFPFTENQVRKTGFQLVHFQPLSFTLDGRTVTCGTGESPGRPLVSADSKSVFFTSETKSRLPLVTRTPYYHFIVNCASGREEDKEQYIALISSFLQRSGLYSGRDRISFTGNVSTTFELKPDFGEKLLHHKNEGAFMVERCLKEILYEQFRNQTPFYPVPVVLNFNPGDEVYGDDFADFLFMTPDSLHFYALSPEGTLSKHPYDYYMPGAAGEPVENITTLSVRQALIEEKQYYLADNGSGSFVFTEPADMGDIKNIKDNRSGEVNRDKLFLIENLTRQAVLHPDKTEKLWRKIYTLSKQNRVLSKYTSFVVLENEAQMKMLLQKERDTLNNKEFFDSGDKMMGMDEPNPLLPVILFLLVLLLLRFVVPKKKRHCQKK